MTRHYTSQSVFDTEATMIHGASGIAALPPSVPASGDVAAPGVDHDKRLSPSSQPFLIYAIGLLMVSILALWPFVQSPHGSRGWTIPGVQADAGLLAAPEAQTRMRIAGIADLMRTPESPSDDRRIATPGRRPTAVVRPEPQGGIIPDPEPIAGQPALVSLFIAHD